METDLSALASMKYSGRGIAVFMTPNGTMGAAYTLTGRSPPSQARELLEGEKTHTIRTSVTDPEQLSKGSSALLIYPAAVPVSGGLVLSNGAQTELIYSTWRRIHECSPDTVLYEAFKVPAFRYDPEKDRWIDITTFEPDAPNNTPRISAAARDDKAAIHIVRCGGDGNKLQEVDFFRLESGKGKLITTYDGDNTNPLQPYVGAPEPIEIGSDSIGEIAEAFYASLSKGDKPGEDWRVAVAAVLLGWSGLETAIINRSQRGD